MNEEIKRLQLIEDHLSIAADLLFDVVTDTTSRADDRMANSLCDGVEDLLVLIRVARSSGLEERLVPHPDRVS